MIFSLISIALSRRSVTALTSVFPPLLASLELVIVDGVYLKHEIRFLDHRGLTMRKHYLLFLSVLVPTFLVLGGYAVVHAQQAGSTAVKGGRWSDAATWADKKVPAKDAVVTIDK